MKKKAEYGDLLITSHIFYPDFLILQGANFLLLLKWNIW